MSQAHPKGSGRERHTLERLLSRLGLCSRTVAAELVRAGRVSVAGRVERSLERWVDPAHEPVALDGRTLVAAEPLTLALHKPKGVLTTFGDPAGRRTVYELLAEVPAWVFPVGRLDQDSSGLLLFTNDSALAERITNPEFGLVKRYRVTTKARVLPAELARFEEGLVLDDGPTRPARASLVFHRGPTSVVEVELHEGRKRQVRRMFSALGRPLKDLRRVAIGPLELGSLASGAWRVLEAAELGALRSALGLSASARGRGQRKRGQ
jgi:23S rRNA pseudouridine2605 synthase